MIVSIKIFILGLTLLFIASCGFETKSASFQVLIKQNDAILEMKINKEKINGGIYNEFEIHKIIYRNGFDNIKPFYSDAQRVHRQSDSAVNEIEKVKIRLIAEIDNVDASTATLKTYRIKESNKWFKMGHTNTFWESEKRLNNIKNSIQHYIKSIEGNYLKTYTDSVFLKLSVITNTYKDDIWFTEHLKNTIPINLLFELTKIQCDIREIENMGITYSLKKLKNQSYKFDSIDAKILSEKYTLKQGETFNATIFLHAYNTDERPSIIVNGRELTNYKEGKGVYSEKATSVGNKKVAGYILMRSYKNGENIKLPFKTEYEVIPAN